MKQNKRTTILKLALLAVCIAVLAIVLVACGGKDKNGNNNEIVNFADNEIFSENALDAYLGYSIENSVGFAFSGHDDVMAIEFEDDSAWILICRNESETQKMYNDRIDDDYWTSEGFVITQNQNVVSVEKEKGIFQNVILKSKIPESYHGSELHMNMIKEAYKSITLCNDEIDYIEFRYEYSEEEESFTCTDTRKGYSQAKFWEFSNNKEYVDRLELLENMIPKLKTEYTDDSFINLNEEEGYYSARLIDRPDTYRYEDYSYKDGDTKVDGIRITDYICTKDSAKSLVVVPAKIDNKPVLDVTLRRLNATTVELSEGIISFNIHNCLNLETIILPKSLKSISHLGPYGTDRGFISGCYSLKTIKYAGTKVEWEALVKDNDPNNWYVSRQAKEDKFWEYTYEYITFKVECSDETITYSHE